MMALGDVLKRHWGAVERDLAVAGYTVDDAGSDRLPVGTFIAFVMHSPPGTAVYHERAEGWTVMNHQLADLTDLTALSVWTKTADAQKKNPKFKPEPVLRPGWKAPAKKAEPQHKRMTVADYAAKVGLTMDFGEG